MSRSTFSVLFYANKSKVKNGIGPVMGRITINHGQRNLKKKNGRNMQSILCFHLISKINLTCQAKISLKLSMMTLEILNYHK